MSSRVPIVLRPVERLGVRAIDGVAGFGDFCIFSGKAIVRGFAGGLHWRNWRLLWPQLFEVGTRSVPVILITGAFIGMVLAVQAYLQFASAGLADRLGAVVNISVVKELGPILAGVMVAGRVGGALTAELGTMRVTEQIDAVRAMGSDPIRYLVVPRFLACLLLTPVLTVFCDLTGVLGGYFISTHVYTVSEVPYWRHSQFAVANWDIATGLIKSLFFGGSIGLISCYKGFNCRAGAEGVGRATTDAFVTNFVVLLAMDFFLAVAMQAMGIHLYGYKQIL
ncbi:MAG: putative phospholipid ABC transporter permease protein MlaE [Phycisphaerae bacterium]|nr:putative phospholipid ABC transporter permease protein MlaE [Phycisphaerae bacterium]